MPAPSSLGDDLIDDDTPPEFIEAVGYVITQWARCERALQQALANLVIGQTVDFSNHTAGAFFVTNGMDGRTLIALIRALSQHLLRDRFDEVNKLLTKIEKCRSKRGDIAHAIWVGGSRPKSRKNPAIKSTGKIKSHRMDYTVDEMYDLVQRMGRNTRAFIDILRSYGLWDPDKIADTIPRQTPGPGRQERERSSDQIDTD